jgi:hypothetical protein
MQAVPQQPKYGTPPTRTPSLPLSTFLTSVPVRYEDEEEDLAELGSQMGGLNGPGTAQEEYHKREHCRGWGIESERERVRVRVREREEREERERESERERGERMRQEKARYKIRESVDAIRNNEIRLIAGPVGR